MSRRNKPSPLQLVLTGMAVDLDNTARQIDTRTKADMKKCMVRVRDQLEALVVGLQEWD